MAGSYRYTLTTTTTSSLIYVANHRIAPVNIAYVATASGFTGTVSYSLDDGGRYTSNGQWAASGTWITLNTATAGTTSFTGAVTFPVRGLKLTGSGAGANDTITITYVQAGITNG